MGETLTLAKLSNLRISQTNEVLLALHSEISTKNNDFQESRVRSQQKLRIPEDPSALTVETSPHIENIVGARFIFDSLGFFSVAFWATTCTALDQFRYSHLSCFLLVANWLNSTFDEKWKWANLFSHRYRLDQSLYLPHFVSPPLKNYHLKWFPIRLCDSRRCTNILSCWEEGVASSREYERGKTPLE